MFDDAFRKLFERGDSPSRLPRIEFDEVNLKIDSRSSVTFREGILLPQIPCLSVSLSDESGNVLGKFNGRVPNFSARSISFSDSARERAGLSLPATVVEGMRELFGTLAKLDRPYGDAHSLAYWLKYRELYMGTFDYLGWSPKEVATIQELNPGDLFTLGLRIKLGEPLDLGRQLTGPETHALKRLVPFDKPQYRGKFMLQPMHVALYLGSDITFSFYGELDRGIFFSR